MAVFDLGGAPVLVVGAGIMGAGIAQVAAQAGHPVFLMDAREGAAADAVAKLRGTLEGLAAKGKLSAEAARAAGERLTPVSRAEEAPGVKLVVEAIVEKLDVKRRLFQELEALVGPDCVLATNTSSISVTAIANGLQHPGRLVGMHFFNPVPLMKLVEVVSGLRTEPAVAAAIFALSQAWGKTPVHAKSTPGFIVNRIARPYYAETLALLQEQAAAPEVLDACLRSVGFRMGPCELMDLIGHDTNFSVTQSVYEANFYDKRYVPSGVQRELVDGGLLGRKTGQGFYRYPEGAPKLPAAAAVALPAGTAVQVMGAGTPPERWAQQLSQAGLTVHREADAGWAGFVVQGLPIVLTDGRTAGEMAQVLGSGEPTAAVAVVDRGALTTGSADADVAYALSGAGTPQQSEAVEALLATFGLRPRRVADVPGLVVARTIAMLINEAADAVQQGVCTPEGADAAMKLGVNYPSGPFEWLTGWSVAGVMGVLERLDAHYRGERYRISPWLRRQVDR